MFMRSLARPSLSKSSELDWFIHRMIIAIFWVSTMCDWLMRCGSVDLYIANICSTCSAWQKTSVMFSNQSFTCMSMMSQ
jgi:hypothetical protein